MTIGTGEIVIVLGLLVLIFGSSRLKDLARGTGEASKELKKARKELKSAFIDEVDEVKPQKETKQEPEKHLEDNKN